MLPHQGQGAITTFEHAVTLADLLPNDRAGDLASRNDAAKSAIEAGSRLPRSDDGSLDRFAAYGARRGRSNRLRFETSPHRKNGHNRRM